MKPPGTKYRKIPLESYFALVISTSQISLSVAPGRILLGSGVVQMDVGIVDIYAMSSVVSLGDEALSEVESDLLISRTVPSEFGKEHW